MMIPDLINGLFELLGGCLIWMDVRQLWRDREIKGVYWPVRIFFMAWGLWNLYYYPSLDQWASFAGGLLICLANLVWCVLAWVFLRKNKIDWDWWILGLLFLALLPGRWFDKDRK